MDDREIGRHLARYEMLRVGEKPAVTDVSDHLEFLAGYRDGVVHTDKMLHTPIPYAQLYRTWRIARAYGHLWAKVIPSRSSVSPKMLLAPPSPAQFWTPGMIRELVYCTRIVGSSTEKFLEMKPIDLGTITVPVFVGDLQNEPSIFHRTAGKHLSYMIYADGTLMVCVYSINATRTSVYELRVVFDQESNNPVWKCINGSYSVEDVRQLKTVFSALACMGRLQVMYRGARDYSPQLELL